jgi:hypothetical protein
VQAHLRVFEGLLGPGALGFDPRELFAQVAVVAAALLGFGFPLALLLDSRVVACEDDVY